MARRTFFSFHYQPDVWRAWNVRNSWAYNRNDRKDDGFFDSSVFEASKRESDDALKAFLREGLKNSSVTCVLSGQETWTRRWVRYEIVRSVIKGNGLLTVDVDGVKNNNQEYGAKGANPLDQVGLYKTDSGVFFAEWENGQWVKYSDYTRSISPFDLWFDAPTSTSVVQVSKNCTRHDFALENGRDNLGGWIEASAARAGR